MSGFKFLGKHINVEYPYLRLVERIIPAPQELPIRDSVVGMQGDYDFSIGVYGERVYGNRIIEYVYHGSVRTNEKKLFDKTTLQRWLLVGSYQPLYDDADPLYYYVAKCIGVELKTDTGRRTAEYRVTFEAYPFKIKIAREGSPFWDDYDESDYYQELSYTLTRSTFKPMKVDMTATVGAWSTQYDGHEGIPRHILGHSYKITEVRETTQGVGNKAYYLAGLEKWVIEQDIVEAQDGAQYLNIFNSGAASIVPRVTLTAPVTFIRGHEVFNLYSGITESDFFRLFAGENRFLVAGGTQAIMEIEIHKEVI